MNNLCFLCFKQKSLILTCIPLWYSNDKQGFSGEVCFSYFCSLHRYCTLIYNASLALHYAACDCHSSDFPLLLLPYVIFFNFCFLLLFPPVLLIFLFSPQLFLHDVSSIPSSCFSFSLSLLLLLLFFSSIATCLHTPLPPLELSVSSFHLPLPFFIMYSSSTHLSRHVSGTPTFHMS